MSEDYRIHRNETGVQLAIGGNGGQTSEEYRDHRERYPEMHYGGNGSPFSSGNVVGGGGGGSASTLPKPTDGKQEKEKAARAFLIACELTPTPDAIAQLSEVFLPCLEIMCERPWDPNGGTWRKSGWLGIMTDVRKKFERLWERAWRHGERHDDSIIDLINYLGFLRRSGASRWGEWGKPYGEAE